MRDIYISILFILFWRYWCALKKARSARVPFTAIMGWLIGLGYFVLVPLTILTINGGYQIPDFYQVNHQYAFVDLSRVDYLVPILVVCVSLLLSFEVVNLLGPRRQQDWRAHALPVDDCQLKRTITVTLVLSILDCVFTVWRAGGVEAFLLSHWYLREERAVASLGDVFVLYTHLSLANQIVFTAAASLLTARQLQRRVVEWRFLFFIGFGLLLQMVLSGNRIFFALYGLSFLTACWLYQRKRLLATLMILSPLILLFFSAWAYFRSDLHAIPESVSTYERADFGNRLVTTLMDATEGSDVMILLHIVNDFGNKFDFLYGETYLKAITFAVPRAIYPNKPENFPVQVAELYEPREITSLSTTQLGEMYANFGDWEVPLLPFVTTLILLLSARLTTQVNDNALISTILFLLFIWYARSSFEDNFITLLFAVSLVRVLRLRAAPLLPTRLRRKPRLAHY